MDNKGRGRGERDPDPSLAPCPAGRSLRGQLPLLLQQGFQEVGSLHGRLQRSTGESSRGPAEPQLGRAGEPSLTSYCFRRLLMLSSFLSTAAFTLTRTRGAEHPRAKLRAGPCPGRGFQPRELSPSPPAKAGLQVPSHTGSTFIASLGAGYCGLTCLQGERHISFLRLNYHSVLGMSQLPSASVAVP